MLKPLNDHLIVKPVNKTEKTASGIILPETTGDKKADRGEVVAVGPGKLLENGTRHHVCENW